MDILVTPKKEVVFFSKSEIKEEITTVDKNGCLSGFKELSKQDFFDHFNINDES